MPTKLEELIAAARQAEMTPEQQEKQRRSFVYGNTNIENDRVTRAVVDEAARTLATDHGEG